LQALSIDTSDINMTPPSREQHARVLGGIGHLVSLQHLTSLLLAFCYDEDTPVLAQMTQLVSSTLRRPNILTDTGLLHLTALTRLTRLEAWLSSPGAALVQPDGARMDTITNKVGLVAMVQLPTQAGVCWLVIVNEHGST
jgi:hypothetical protein